MPPARFGASKFRNAIPSVLPTDTWYRTNLPAAANSNSTSSSLSTLSSEIKSDRRWIVTVSASGDVSWRMYAGEEVGSMKAGAVGDWDLSGLEDETVVIGGTDGNLRIYTLPASAGGELKEEQTIPIGSPITTVCLHPTTPHLVLVASTQTPLSIYELSTSSSSSAAFTLELEESKGLWTAGWSNDGTRVAAVGRSGKGYVFDPRQSTKSTITKQLSIQPLKPVRLVWVDDKIFLTGWDRSRNRQYLLISPDDLSTVFTQNLDTNLSPLIPVVDEERKIIYVAGRGDMTVRQVELGGVTGFQETVHPLPHALASTSLAAVHPSTLEVMQAEIGRLLVPVVDKDGDAIMQLGVKVPRRQLIDYHEDLYPDIKGSIPEQSTQEWLSGGNSRPLSFTLDPSRRNVWEARLAAQSASSPKNRDSEVEKATVEVPDESKKTLEIVQPDQRGPTVPTSVAEQPKDLAAQSDRPGQVSVTDTRRISDSAVEDNTPERKSESQSDSLASAPITREESTLSEDTQDQNAEYKTPQPTKLDQQVPKSSASRSAPSQASVNETTQSASKPSTPSAATSRPSDAPKYIPGWSRKFLAGKSPLNPTYDSIPALSSLHQDSHIFKVNASLAFFPVQGPGGRLGVHPLKKKGRMVTGGEGYLSGGVEIADFDIEPFGTRVAIGGEDGIIRVWSVGEDGVRGVGPEAEQVVKGDGVDKIATVAFHPTAKDLLTVLTNDQGTCAVRLFDLQSGNEERKVTLDLDGAFNMVWSPAGDKVAVATKDGRMMVLDPRSPESSIVGAAHDSPRSFQITWIDQTHLISVGFSRGSQRRINLYSITDTDSIRTISSFTMDISPSVLFPQYDPDTHILYVWGKGERQIQAFEIRPDQDLEPISKLPSFTSGSPQLGVAFFSKRLVDVRKVEVAKTLRLTSKAIEEVSFTIPRNKPEFFQDDIYVDTLDIEHSILSAQEWLEGKKVDERYISLRPEGMNLLSEAPKVDTAAKKKFVPAANVMSEEERKRKEMNDLFQRAKMDESSDEDEPKQSGLAPPDDDW